VAFNFVPTRETFVQALAGSSGDAARGQMHDYLTQMTPLLKEIHTYLVSWAAAVAFAPTAHP
jgi:hypothetical protein